VRIVADYILFDTKPVPLYEMEDWLAEEVREVLMIHRANYKPPEGGRPPGRGRETA
jgi:hypothetical protein